MRNYLKKTRFIRSSMRPNFWDICQSPRETIEPIPPEEGTQTFNHYFLNSPSFELVAMKRKGLKSKVYTIGLKDYIAYFFERLFLAGFIFFTRFIPITYLYPGAARIGKIGVVLSPAYKKRVLGNLNLAFGKEKR